MKLPIIASAIVALAMAVPSLASQAEGAGTPTEETTEPMNTPVAEGANQPTEPATAEEGKEEHHKKKAKKRKGRKHHKHAAHHARHHKDCDGKHAPSEPCNPGHFCPDK